jgi:hypothetical protein
MIECAHQPDLKTAGVRWTCETSTNVMVLTVVVISVKGMSGEPFSLLSSPHHLIPLSQQL